MSNEKQQTALDQFAIALYEGGYLQGNGDEIQELLGRFKKTEKGQIIDALLFGDVLSLLTAEQYYRETYGGNK